VVLTAALGLWATAGGGCASEERPKLSEAQLAERSAAHDAEVTETFHASIGRMMDRFESRTAAAADPSSVTIEVLSISGGGDYGAFGAGFLSGWGQAPGAARRPEFDAVTGVSTGALLSPFAYLGSPEMCDRVEQFYRNPQKDWIRSRGLLFFLPSNPSFMEVQGLERDINATMDPAFIARMAEESRKGRLLFISATDLDLGVQQFWDVGRVAEEAQASGNPQRLQKILMASAAIPAVFPPVDLDDRLYADGGVTANVFLRLEPHSPNGLIQRWKAEHPARPLPKVRYWVIINNWMRPPPATVQRKWPSVMMPSLTTATRSATISEVRWLAAQADYTNAVLGTNIEVRMVAIPSDWRPPVEGDFRKETMESLADLGRNMGADPASWRLLSSPDRPGGMAR
jgi:hypothetical protein